MIHPWHDLPAGHHPPDQVTAIIEIPAGSRNKYELDKETGPFRLDRGEPDEKIVAVPAHDPFQNEFFDIADIPRHSLKEIEHFFQIYKDLEGKRVTLIGWDKSEVAMQEIMKSVGRYEEKYGNGRKL